MTFDSHLLIMGKPKEQQVIASSILMPWLKNFTIVPQPIIDSEPHSPFISPPAKPFTSQEESVNVSKEEGTKDKYFCAMECIWDSIDDIENGTCEYEDP